MPTTLKTPMPAPALPPGKRWKKRFKRMGWIGLGFLAMGVVVFLLLPVWMSNAQGRAWVLDRLNAGSAARISCDDWSLSWFKGTRIKNLAITLPDNSRLLFCPHIKTELTLWGILRGNYDLGATTVETLQVNLTKYADGSTSLDALSAPPSPATPATPGTGLLERLRSLRGSLQVQSAVVTVNSALAGGGVGESVTYTDVRAALTIAAADAPFHLALTATGPDRSLSVNAVLPAPASWPPPPWVLLQDLDVSATNMPTGLLCDWLGLDPRWQDSLGPAIATLSLVHHAASGETGDATLLLRGSGNPPSGGAAFIQGHALLRVSPDQLSLSCPEGAGFRSSLRVSVPLGRLLAHANPVFSALHSADGPIDASLSELRWQRGVTGDGLASAGTLRINFPQLHFERTGILGQLLTFAGVPQDAGGAVGGGAPLVAEASPLRLEIADGVITCDNFSLTFPPPPLRERLEFSGRITPDGRMNLLATVPLAQGAVGPDGQQQTLGAGLAQVPITGPVDRPALVLPR